ncbi:hypothetical protein A2886_01035 [candidate division WWE3 bacterium RIFCSPHIGHO2_01_FULL_42_13]|uniref:Uncharacterized protein n=1 Tax=candidate division WWE3 bacterium RIFCSPHIGHO2_01_FULL_42_13 TaxID=1802617 RepID=A0A1F4UQI4_UNCKA|nr:MAG: hypothetical protein A2886_01035 [candidate division WWE3 bacterium RIFCSPHIGHO2_01_FULL_42_13]
MKDKYLLHFAILLFGILVSAFFFVYFRFNSTAQAVVAGMGCIYYIGWGIIHHAVRGRLSRLIALEYILVGSLIFLLLLTSITL